ncbi:MAG: hypothetical protein JWQ84_3115 [Mucilaginibacter sp.]|jgi:hypothetical protein|nr:hypothetical protein [Mucilaginibacter sp.]MDB5018283.1 hypothetical protein [Mucilaginibacter sp.]
MTNKDNRIESDADSLRFQTNSQLQNSGGMNNGGDVTKPQGKPHGKLPGKKRKPYLL